MHVEAENKRLADICLSYATAVREADGWINDNKELVGSEYESLSAELRKTMRSLRKCQRSAPRKMCVGVFGPSQSGKSYLISALAKDSSDNLTADFGGQKFDFIKQINPPGGKESTGLVTRFTLDKPTTPKGYPVRLRLLSEMDIIKIIANTYYSDCEHEGAVQPEAISATLDQLLRKRSGSMDPRVKLDDLEDLRAYLDKNFRAKPRPQVLNTVYWPRAIAMAPELSQENRAQLFAMIWEGVERFTSLYRRLHAALEKLNFPEDEVYCQVEALIPRERSIIDVATLKGLGQEHSAEVEIVDSRGRKARLARPELAALTAEITIPMLSKPADFFDHTDLLDFPGYRSRLKSKDIRRQLEEEGSLENYFLRGKVAYLFERYNDERELTSMLLCIGPGNQEVQDLPGVIDRWIRSTHGESPEKRIGKDIALFFILTKFDMEFEKKKGAPSNESRWLIRLQSSMLDFFGKQHQWPRDWDGKQAFNNLFFLRNPNVECEAIFEYSSNRKERGIRPEQKDDIANLKRRFLETPEVRSHFAEPERAWEAAMSLNDGGIQYLRERLSPLCNPELKRKQIRNEVKGILERLDSKLRGYYQSDDKAEERKKKAALAKQLATTLAKVAETKRFGEFLRKLQVVDSEMYELRFQVDSQFADSGGQSPDAPPRDSVVGVRVSSKSLLEDLFGPGEGGGGEARTNMPVDSDAEKTSVLPKDEAEYFASLIENNWIERLKIVADSQTYQTYFSFPPQDFEKFNHELIQGARRLELRKHVEEAIRKASRYRNMRRDKLIWKEVSVAAHIINAYVNWLGFDPNQADDKARTVTISEKPRELFKPAAPVVGYPKLQEDQPALAKKYYTDWLAAFITLVMRNVDFDGHQSVNLEENARLGRILEAFNPNTTRELHLGGQDAGKAF